MGKAARAARPSACRMKRVSRRGRSKALPLKVTTERKPIWVKNCSELPDEALFLGEVAEKKLADPELLVPEVAEADQERDDSDSAGKPGRLQVQEERRGKVALGEGSCPG